MTKLSIFTAPPLPSPASKKYIKMVKPTKQRILLGHAIINHKAKDAKEPRDVNHCHTSLVGTYLFDLVYHRYGYYHSPAICYSRTRSRRVLETAHLAGTEFTTGQSFPCIALPRSDFVVAENRISVLSQSLQLASAPLTTPSFSLLNKKKRRFRSTKPTKIDCEYLAGPLGRPMGTSGLLRSSGSLCW